MTRAGLVEPGNGSMDIFYFKRPTIDALIAAAGPNDQIVLRFGCLDAIPKFSGLTPYLCVMNNALTAIQGNAVYEPDLTPAMPAVPPAIDLNTDITKPAMVQKKGNFSARNTRIATFFRPLNDWFGFGHSKTDWQDLLTTTSQVLGAEPQIFVVFFGVDDPNIAVRGDGKILIGGVKDVTQANSFFTDLAAGRYRVFDNGNQCCTAPE